MTGTISTEQALIYTMVTMSGVMQLSWWKILAVEAVGVLVTALGALVGVPAGYFGGKVDEGLSVLMNVFLVLPGLPLAIVLAAWLPPGPGSIIAVLTLTGWAWTARVLRAQTLSLRRRDFVSAALVSGESHAQVMLREILPNILSPLAVVATLEVALAITEQIRAAAK